MKRSSFTSYVQLALLIGAFAVGTLLARLIPSPYKESAAAPADAIRPVAVSPSRTARRDASNDLSSFDASMRRLNDMLFVS